MMTLEAMIIRAEQLSEALEGLAADLRRYRDVEVKAGTGALKQPDGRLTEQGVRMLEAAVLAGTPTRVIAAALGVSVPAVSYRKKRVLSKKSARSSQSRRKTPCG